LWLSLGIAMLLFGIGCRRGVPVDVAPKAPVSATVTGVVRGLESTSVSGRTVEIVNTATGERRVVQTADNGGFTAVVPSGTYRLDLSLRDGETIVKRPAIVDVNAADLDSHVEFVLGPTRIVHPRGPGYRVDNGLGSPTA